ncbi:MAG TPA: glycosyltransferase family 39 protein [Acidimicrobiales bacterium]
MTGTAPDVSPAATPGGGLRAFVRSWWGKVLLITLLGLGIRLVYVAAYPRCDWLTEDCRGRGVLSGDAIHYHDAANLLADGEGFIEPYRFLNGGYGVVDVEMADGTIQQREVITPVGHREPTALHPPGYVVYLALFSLAGLRSVLAHQIASALLGTAAIPLFAVVGRRLVGERTGLIAAAVAAVYAMLWINDALVMSETMVIVVVAATMLAALRFRDAPTVWNGIVLGASGALATLTRTELAMFLPIAATWIVLRSSLPWRRRLAVYAACGLSGMVVVAPWVIRNLVVFENPVYLSSSAGTVLVQTNCDATYYGDNVGYWNLECGHPLPYGPNGELLDESERDPIVRQRALDYISNHKQRLVTVVIPARIARMLSLYQPLRQLDLEVLSEERAWPISLTGLIQYALLVPFGIAGSVALWRRRLAMVPITLWIGMVVVTSAFAFGNMRYRVSAEPALVVLAAVGIEALWCRIRRPEHVAGTLARHPVLRGRMA